MSGMLLFDGLTSGGLTSGGLTSGGLLSSGLMSHFQLANVRMLLFGGLTSGGLTSGGLLSSGLISDKLTSVGLMSNRLTSGGLMSVSTMCIQLIRGPVSHTSQCRSPHQSSQLIRLIPTDMTDASQWPPAMARINTQQIKLLHTLPISRSGITALGLRALQGGHRWPACVSEETGTTGRRVGRGGSWMARGWEGGAGTEPTNWISRT